MKDYLGVLAVLTFIVSMASLSLSLFLSDMFGQSSSLKPDDKAIIANVAPIAPKQQTAGTVPARFIAPTADLAVNVQNSTIDVATNTWPLSDTSAHYANFTAKFGDDRGTMLMYGHNTLGVMQKTDALEIGDTVYLVDENGKNWPLRFTDERTILPTETAFIYEDTSFRVAMFTCDGPNDEYRRLMFFTPIQ